MAYFLRAVNSPSLTKGYFIPNRSPRGRPPLDTPKKGGPRPPRPPTHTAHAVITAASGLSGSRRLLAASGLFGSRRPLPLALHNPPF